ncbi:MAG: tRNA (N(6)-L-threonylcarbamoyladenosine(37)-C(2))-methylthiotransferase MtaB [Thermodesulfobacteriota bacterium]
MPKFRIITFGCKVNQVDSAGMAQGLVDLGWRGAVGGEAPDLVLVNTCTVTARADQQARQAIRRQARECPGAPLFITGCYAQRAPAELMALQGVTAVLGNREKGNLPQLMSHFAPDGPPLVRVSGYSPGEPFQAWQVRHFPGQTRARLKVQDGCNHACAYCLVPQVRGPRRSLEAKDVAAALKDLGQQGYQEVVLTGIDLGQYGQDLSPASSLAALLGRLANRSWPFRLRLSSLEPQEITSELLQALTAFPGLCPHFHLPLQSGSDPVLRAMRRPYRAQDFKNVVRELNRAFPEAALGLDILVGFPGESTADFTATYDLAASLPISYLHVFPFSPRPGTPAASLAPLPAPEVRRRASALRNLGWRKKLEFYQSQVGRMGEVLVEGPGLETGWLQGLSANYLRVILPGPPDWRNRRVRVRFQKVQGESLLGELMEPLE